jgi:hypothetical protein
VLEVPITFFFEGAPGGSAKSVAPELSDISDFVSSSEGLALIRAFRDVKDPQLRRGIVNLVEEIAGPEKRRN